VIGKLLIGAIVVVGGYYAYQAYKSRQGTPGALLPNSSSTVSEQAAALSQKYLPGGSGWLEGSCMGCMGGAPVQIL
jgi:hypothetical protein